MGKVLLGRVARGLRVWVGFLLFTTLDGAVWAQPAGQATSVWRRFRLSFSFFTTLDGAFAHEPVPHLDVCWTSAPVQPVPFVHEPVPSRRLP